MAKDKDNSSKTPEDDSGLGNLPPLSDFDSSGGSDSGDEDSLPPLGSFESDSGSGGLKRSSLGGLPPIGDVSVETPNPTGGNIKAAPPGFESAEFESPGFETPPPPKRGAGTGFQDLAADSDFSPETPEIGPGPDSDVDTPMFDSAFGGGSDTFTPSFETPAPTQAMETPMFGQGAPTGEIPGFDDGAFAPGGGFDMGTPAPDFSPDTGMTGGMGGAPVPPPSPAPVARAEKKRGGGGGGGKSGVLIAVLAAVVLLIVGLAVGPYLSTTYLTFLPNPLKAEVEAKDAEVLRLNKRVDELQKLQTPGGEGPVVSQEKIDEMIQQQKTLTESIAKLEQQQQEAQGNLDRTSTQLDQVRADLDARNEEFVRAQEAFDDLQNQTAIVQARQLGLLAEVDRLTTLTGGLEDANERRRLTKEALLHSVDQLMVVVKEGIPLTPEKFSHRDRVAAVEALRGKVEAAKWVDPQLLDEYTALYTKELEIADSTDYFFAKVPTTDRFGGKADKWAECVMRGNWAVAFRTLDGKDIGVYENIAPAGNPPVFGFRTQLVKEAQMMVENEVFSMRPADYEKKLQAIAEKQIISQGDGTEYQQVFDSL